MLCMSIHGMSKFTEPFFLQRTTWPRKRRRQRRPPRQPPRRWQRRLQRKRSSRTTKETFAPTVATWTHRKTFPKGLNVRLQPIGFTARQDKAGSLCRWRLHKGPFFVCPSGRDLLLRQGSKPHGRDA